MKSILPFLSFFCFFFVQAESYLYFQNNTSLDVQINITSTLSSSYWVDSYSGVSEAWRLQTKIFEVNRNTGISNGSDFFLTTNVILDGQTISLKTKLTGTFTSSNIWCSASGPGFSNPWYDDYNFHEETFTINGKDYNLKYQFDLPIGNIFADMYYVLHEVNPFPAPVNELSDPNILNVLSYNIYMLTPPIGSSEEIQRAAILQDYVKNYDVIILNEAFYNTARTDELIPNLSIEYPYYSDVVDDSGYPEDGGVLIFSRWPILNEEQHIYSVCDGSDCLSSKGVKYVEIDKLGKPYHLFGTHTQAWPDAASVAVRLEQLGELYVFVEAQNIPTTEAVIIGGDLNVNKSNTNQNLEYFPMLDTLHVTEPQYLGAPYTYNPDYNTYASGSDFEYLDFVFSEKDHFCAYSSSNEVLILRHVVSNDDFWDNNSLDLDLSDHYAIHGRLEYPYFLNQPSGISVCEGDSFLLSAGVNKACTYQWYFNGQAISNGTDSLLNFASNVTGSLYCIASYACGSIQSNTVSLSFLSSANAPTVSISGNDILANASGATIQWYDDNGIITGATSTVYSTCDSGNYYAIATSANGCSSAASNVVNYLGTLTTPIITLQNDSLFSDANIGGNQWYDDNGAIFGATNSSFVPLVAGNYYVVVFNGNCESDSSNTINFTPIPTSIRSNLPEVSILMNNPVSNGVLYLQVNDLLSSSYEVSIVNLLGQVVYFSAETTPNIQVDVSSLQTAYYFVKVHSDEQALSKMVWIGR